MRIFRARTTARPPQQRHLRRRIALDSVRASPMGIESGRTVLGEKMSRTRGVPSLNEEPREV
ncbi:hypothetical protein C8Q78DRAFT_495231 [Trametes maxima]|nr:hypothetical protein C8Q78DRAFT_495231 [Trametes maxima]